MSTYLKSFVALIMFGLSVGSAVADGDLPVALLSSPKSDLSRSPDDSRMMVELAVKYEHAEGVPRDLAMAMALYCRAAKLGNVDAQYALGWMYANGRGIPRDDGVAAQLFALAAGQGHEYARNMMQRTQSSSSVQIPACVLPDEKAEPKTETVLEKEAKQEVVATEGDGSISDEHVYPNGPIFKLVHQLAPRYDVDPKLAMAVISVESGFNVRAQSPKNAQGLMQLIPETAQRFRVKDAFDAKENIKGGLAYLQWLLAFFKGNVSLVAAAYNAGEKAVEKYRGVPPYPETQDYVQKIARLYRKTEHPYRRNLVESSSAVITPAGDANKF